MLARKRVRPALPVRQDGIPEDADPTNCSGWGNTTAHLGHLQFTDARIAYVKGTGSSALDADPNRAGTQLHGVGMQQAAVAGNVHALVDIGGTIYNLQTTPTNVFRVSNTVLPAATTEDYVMVNPFISYRRKINRFMWSFQLNVNNLLDNRSN